MPSPFAGLAARLAVLLTAAVGAVGLAPATGFAATLALEHDNVVANDVGGSGNDGVIAAGDTVDLTETLLSSNLLPLSGLTGTLTASGGVTVLTGGAPFSDVSFGATTANTSPFQIQVPGNYDCGRTIDLSLAISDGASGTVTIPVTVSTGLAGAPRSEEALDVPLAIPANGSALESQIFVAQSGRVKDVRVRIGRITHPYVEDLRLELVHPDGTVVVLADRVGGASDDYVDTVFAPEGASITSAPAPRTGTFRAQGDLKRLEGKPTQGAWKLRIVDLSPADNGTLESWGTDTSSATCIAQPIASFVASPTTVQVGGTVTFDASASSDPVGTITSYNWDLDGDGSFETNTGTNPVVQHTYTSQATVVVRLRIDDDQGLSNTLTRTIAVTVPPTASFSASPASPTTGETVTFDGGASSDADGNVVRWQWDLDGNGSFERDSTPSSSTTGLFATPGDRNVRLRVTDDNGATAIVAQTIAVQNRNPAGAFTPPSPAVVGRSATFDASASTDPDGAVVLYAWDLDGNGSYETGPDTSPIATRTYGAPGTVTVSMRATDDLGAQHVVTHDVTVTAPPLPALGATPNPARPGQTVTFSGAASTDPDGSIARYEWDLDGDGSYEIDGGATPTTTSSYAQPQSLVVRLRVTDNVGASTATSAVVDVVNLFPSAVLGATPNPAVTGSAVTFDASASSDPDGSIAHYEWDLDGTGGFETDGGATPTINHTYPNPTAFIVRVRVTDNEGGQAIASLPLTINLPSTGGGGTGGGTTGGGTTGGGTTGGGTTGGGTTGGTTGGGTSGGGTTSGGTGAGGSAANSAGGAFAAALVGEPIQKLKTVMKKGAAMAVYADRGARVTLVAEILPAEVKRLKLAKGKKARKAIRLGRFVISPALGKPATFKVKVPKKYRAKLAKARTVSVVVRGTAVATSGGKLGLSRALLLRR